MTANDWLLIIGAFFSGLTAFAAATIPLIMQLRSNQKTVAANTVITAANTAANASAVPLTQSPEDQLARIRTALTPLVAPDGGDPKLILESVRAAVLPLLVPPVSD